MSALDSRKLEVIKDFSYVWYQYVKNAPANDSMNALTGEGVNDKGGIASLMYANIDTMYLLGSEENFEKLLRIVGKHSFSPVGPVKAADFTKDVVGGLLGAFYMSEKNETLEKAKEFTEILLEIYSYKEFLPKDAYSFESKSAKFSHPNIKTVNAFNLAEILVLYQHTGDERLLKVVENADNFVGQNIKKIDIVSSYIITKDFKVEVLKFGPNFNMDQDSVHIHRNLFNAWLLSNKTASNLKALYDISKRFIIKNLTLTNDKGSLFISNRYPDKPELNYKMHQAACAYAGQLALENDIFEFNITEVNLAKRLMDTCIHFYVDSPKGLGPSIAEFTKASMSLPDQSFSVIPEIFEGLFHLFRLTNDDSYRTAAYFIYSKIREKCRTQFGFANLNANSEPIGNLPEGLLSRVFKYLYLIFSDESLIQSENFVFTPAGHIYKLT